MFKNADRAVADYLEAVRKNLAHGDATEHTHRPALKDLLEAVGRNITATNDPKRIKCGAPDFNITRRKIPLGHVETKDIGINLNEMERGRGPNGEQFTGTNRDEWMLDNTSRLTPDVQVQQTR